MENSLNERIQKEQSHRKAMQKAKEEAALTMNKYQEHVEETQRQIEGAQKDPEADSDCEDEESVRVEEEALRQHLGSNEKDITELTGICNEQKKEIEKKKQTYDFRLKWAREQRGRRQSSSSEAEAEVEAEAGTQAENRSNDHNLDQDTEEGRPSRKSS